MRSLLKAGIIGAVACILAVSAGARSVADRLPPILDLYRQTIKAMRDVKQPAYVTFRLESTSQGLRGDFQGTHHCNMSFCISPGNNTDRWMLWYRTDDFKTAILDLQDGRHYASDWNFFDPTWYGPYRALRVGMLNVPYVPPSALPNATPTPDVPFKTIATVNVFGPGIYKVSDGGIAACPNGDPGRAVHLASRTHDPRHQLSDVIIDLKNVRFCSVRLTLHGRPVGVTAYWEGHYAGVGDYWMLTDGLVASTTRILGFAASSGEWHYRLSDMQFPNSLPPDTFVPTPVPSGG